MSISDYYLIPAAIREIGGDLALERALYRAVDRKELGDRLGDGTPVVRLKEARRWAKKPRRPGRPKAKL